MKDFKRIKTEEYTALFINSEIPPEKIIPQHIYKYSGHPISKDFRGFELFEIFYIQEELISHPILTWYEVEVPPQNINAFMAACDINSGARNFLERK